MKKMILVLLASFPGMVWAQSVYTVDQGGGGTHTTIVAAVVTAVNGDTIKVLKGTYSESIIVAERLIFIAQDSTEVVSGADAFILNTGSDGTVIDNFILKGNIDMNAFPNSSANRVIISNNTMIDAQMTVGGVTLVANNIIRRIGLPGAGISVVSSGLAASPCLLFNNTLRACGIATSNANYVDIFGNSIDNYTGTGIDAVVTGAGTWYLRAIANKIDSCTFGIRNQFSGSSETVNFTGANNLITNCPTAINFSCGSNFAVYVCQYTNNVIFNSTTASATYTGNAALPGSTFNFYSNILSTNTGNISFADDIWDNNCLFNSGTVPSPGTGNITSNPLLTNPSAGNFTLQGGSPCINTGYLAFIYTDIDKTRNDMGVYGGPYTLTNFSSGSNAKVVDIRLVPASVIQGNTITITGSGTGN